MIFNGLNMMKHSFKNHIFTINAIDFSLLKSRALVDFTRLKSGDPVRFQSLPALAHGIAHMDHVYAQASWKAGSELEAGLQAG